MRKDIYKSKRTKRTEITSWALIVVVLLALLSPFIYRKVLVRDVRVNASDLDCGEETMNVEVSSSIYDNVVEGEYHEFTVVTDTLITGKKRVRIYY